MFNHYTTGQTGSSNRSDRSVWRPPRSHRSDRSTDRSDRSNQNRLVAPSARKCATQQTPSLRISIHHFPLLCITADKFDTAGAEIHVRVSWNDLGSNKSWAINTQQDLPDQWVYLAHVYRHARHLAGGYFAEKATKVIPYFHYFSSRFYV